MKQLLVDAQALRAAELHIPVEEQVEVVEALGDDRAQLWREALEVTLEVYAVVVEISIHAPARGQTAKLHNIWRPSTLSIVIIHEKAP